MVWSKFHKATAADLFWLKQENKAQILIPPKHITLCKASSPIPPSLDSFLLYINMQDKKWIIDYRSFNNIIFDLDAIKKSNISGGA